MTCGECSASARYYNGQYLDNSRYTYCSLRSSGSYQIGNYKANGWTKVNKNSKPKWCPRGYF